MGYASSNLARRPKKKKTQSIPLCFFLFCAPSKIRTGRGQGNGSFPVAESSEHKGWVRALRTEGFSRSFAARGLHWSARAKRREILARRDTSLNLAAISVY
jgi:hypothetical protein